jgi:hypothetical protein
MLVGGQRNAPDALPPGMTRYPLFRRLGEPRGWPGRVHISCFDPRTVHPVASCYTYYAIPARLVIPMRAAKHVSLSRLSLSVVEY